MEPKDFNFSSLEDAFFTQENARLLENLRAKSDLENRREMLRQVVRIEDETFLDRLIALGVGPEAALALRLIPLVFVAWADGGVDKKEREAILEAAKQKGLAGEKTARELLAGWLLKRPDPKLLALWKEYVGHVWNRFTPDEQWEMRKSLLDDARDVAEAAGGFLGLTSKISIEEQAVLNDLESVFA